MKSTQSIIESILKAQNPGIALTPREIYSEMDSSEKGFFSGGVETVRKAMGYLKKKGIVENGISEIVNGSTVLTWKMADAKVQQKPTENIQDAMQTEELETIYEESSIDNGAKIEIVKPQMAEGLEFHNMIENFGAGVNAFIEGTKKLIAELDETKAKKPPVLTNKTEKVTLLKFMQSFHGKLNEDVDRVLGDIISDLEKMEEAA